MNRDLDLVAIPWEEKVGSVNNMIKAFCKILDGKEIRTEDSMKESPHGRTHRIINIYRGGYIGEFEKTQDYTEDPQYYIDISIMPTLNKK